LWIELSNGLTKPISNIKYSEQRICCSNFSRDFKGFYKKPFLNRAYFVVVENIPKPDFPKLRQMGLGDFINLNVDGITYKDTYYIKQHCADNLRLHFHELVHVAQWKQLGAVNFIQCYINEINSYGYLKAPLEEMA
jgi:hypothetical protein